MKATFKKTFQTFFSKKECFSTDHLDAYDFGSGHTRINMSDLKDPKFEKAYARAIKNNPHGQFPTFKYRDYIVSLFATNALHLEGAFLFVGISWGCAARLVLEYCDLDKKTIYLVDSWEQIENPISNKIPTYCGDFDFIKKEFGGKENIKIIKGLAPEAFSHLKNEVYSFVHISIDSNEAELESVLKVYDKCVKGAFILLDCYGTNNGGKGWTNESKQRLKKAGIIIIPFLNGQGLIIKN